MKRILLTASFILIAIQAFAQVETFDITTYQPPKGWKKTTGQGYVIFEDHKEGFCMLVLYASRKSSGDADQDFQKEWADLVLKPNGTIPEPQTQKEKTTDGWTAVTGVSTLKEGDVEYALMLVTATGFGKVTSVLAKVAGESYLPAIDNFLTTMQLNPGVENTGNASAPMSKPVSPNDHTLVGKWGKSESAVGAYTNDLSTNLAFSGYKKGEYEFKGDGTYYFQGENWGGQVNTSKFRLNDEKEYGLIDETGSYQINGNQLIIVPAKNVYRVVLADGQLKRTETLGLEKRTYTWQTYYASGMEETRLVLTASKENQIDGDFSSFEPAVSFPNSFCYSLGKKMFFKFLPLT